MQIRFRPALLAAALVAPILLQGCYGQFGLTRKLYTWNGSVGDKWINSIILFAFNVVPVYGAVATVDYLLLNTIEFWTGKNPVALGPSERETRVVSIDGKDFVVTSVRNRLDIVPAEGDVEALTLNFDPEQKAWFASYRGETRKVAQEDGEALSLIHSDGRMERVPR